jgi:hypothetical protein
VRRQQHRSWSRRTSRSLPPRPVRPERPAGTPAIPDREKPHATRGALPRRVAGRTAIPRCQVAPLPVRGRCGMRRSKQDSTQMRTGCTQNTRMGLGPAWCFTADVGQPNPGSRAKTAALVPSAWFACIPSASAKNLACLAARRMLPRRGSAATPQAPYANGRAGWRCGRAQRRAAAIPQSEPLSLPPRNETSVRCCARSAGSLPALMS